MIIKSKRNCHRGKLNYRVLFHYFDQFLAEYESRFEKEYGFLRPIVKDVRGAVSF
jgi:hypothetical protein